MMRPGNIKLSASSAPRADGYWKTFDVGDRVEILNPHDDAHSTGTIQMVSGETPYGVLVDGMEDMGIHKWYTTEELELESPSADMDSADDPEASKRKKKRHDKMKMSAKTALPAIPVPTNRKVTALSTDGAIERWNPKVRAKAEDDEATISIYEVIGEDYWTGGGVTVKRIDAALRSVGNRDVTVNINSPGGDVFEGIAIYNRLREHQGKITVKVFGLAASAASIIAMAGDNVQVGAASFIMIHNAWVLAVGNRHDLRDVAEFLEPFDRALADVYVARSQQPLEAVQAAMDAETWMSGGQAVELGYADALLAADEAVTTDEPEPEEDKVKAIRRAEAALTKEMPRSAAFDLLNKIKGTSDSAPGGRPHPDDERPHGTSDSADLCPALAGLLATIRG